MSWEWVLERDEVAATDVSVARSAEYAAWPEWFGAEHRARLAAAGIQEPWKHQAEFSELLVSGQHAIICTGTGSGKSLGYLMPILSATVDGFPGAETNSVRSRLTSQRPTALYLSPTKALSHDQARSAKQFGPTGWRVMALDGDSPEPERRFAREHASFLLTNPDMLHFSILPQHQRWSRFLGSLRYIVLDEAHRYQGVFGAHIANVVRRLRRLAALHGADPILAISSATAPNAVEFGQRLSGAPSMAQVAEDASPRGSRTLALWRTGESLNQDASLLLARLASEDHQTIAFIASRQGAELVTLGAQEHMSSPSRIAAYRGGYLAADRRALEAGLQSGELTGLASTNALELGIDVAAMDAVLIAGYPGKLSSFWQQAGRAGRRSQDSLVVMLGRDNPLDAYLLDHPELVFRAPVERAVLHPEMPRVRGLHVAAAAQEHPLSAEDRQWFGEDLDQLAASLAKQGVLRDRGDRFYWTRMDRAVDFISLRSAGEKPIDIIESETGRVLGALDDEAADRALHPGAVYLHQGDSFLVQELDFEHRQAFVTAARLPYYTQAQSTTDIKIVRVLESRQFADVSLSFGEVELDSQVGAYLRRDEVTHEVWDSTELQLPRRRLFTQAVWWTIRGELHRELGWSELEVGAAAHAMEHTAISLLPVFAPCDRWDIGGVSTPLHPDTGLATVFVHDAMSGGAGFAQRGYEQAEAWLAATLDRLQRCPCLGGCPACVVSPKCGNANQVLNKDDASRLLALLMGHDPQP